jgi:hypothetical protein
MLPSAGFAFNEDQPHPRTHLLQLLTHTAHGQGS